jgi:hypothetical protein
MTAWTDDDLRRIGQAEELEISPVRRTGELRRRTPIWVVRAGDDLYVRAAYGAASGWHGVVRASGRARIWAGGVERHVAVEDAGAAVLDAVVAGYRSKYGSGYAGIVDKINDEDHRRTTLRLVPEEPR